MPHAPTSSSPASSRFYKAVASTGLYCWLGCPTHSGTPGTLMLFTSAPAAEAAGFRACSRCRPMASPEPARGDGRADLVARAIGLINQGVVDDVGVRGLAHRLTVGERHLHRQMVLEVGVGPLSLARARRAQTARLLLEATNLPVPDVAFAAGYATERECDEALHETFGRAASQLRRHSRVEYRDGCHDIVLRLAHRRPYAVRPLLDFLATRSVGGVEDARAGTYRRSMRLPRSYGILTATPSSAGSHITARLQLGDLRDLTAAVRQSRRLFDLDADPEAIAAVLGADQLLAPLVRRWPGLRVPGHVDGFELAVRAVLGQQVTVKGARTLAERLVRKLGTRLDAPAGPLTHLFPSAAALADDDLSGIGLTSARIRALRGLADGVASGRVVLDPSADRNETTRNLLALPGIGPWTAAYIAMRALDDSDAIPLTDLGIRQALRLLGVPPNRRELAARAERWRPWRSYAALHLWAHLADPAGDSESETVNGQ